MRVRAPFYVRIVNSRSAWWSRTQRESCEPGGCHSAAICRSGRRAARRFSGTAKAGAELPSHARIKALEAELHPPLAAPMKVSPRRARATRGYLAPQGADRRGQARVGILLLHHIPRARDRSPFWGAVGPAAGPIAVSEQCGKTPPTRAVDVMCSEPRRRPSSQLPSSCRRWVARTRITSVPILRLPSLSLPPRRRVSR